MATDLGESAAGFLMSFCISTLGSSPRSFWTTAARGWIVDEDIHNFDDAGAAKRKEGTYNSLQQAVRNFGNGLALACCLLYMAHSAGQISINCMPFDKMTEEGLKYNEIVPGYGHEPQWDNCTALATAVGPNNMEGILPAGEVCCNMKPYLNTKSFEDCCYDHTQAVQPATVKSYILFLYGVFCPLMNLVSLVFTYIFPITGEKDCERTHRIIKKQKTLVMKHGLGAAAATLGGTQLVAITSMKKVQVAVPEGCTGGETISIDVNGQNVTLQVPEGVKGGQMMEIDAPAAKLAPKAKSTAQVVPVRGGVSTA